MMTQPASGIHLSILQHAQLRHPTQVTSKGTKSRRVDPRPFGDYAPCDSPGAQTFAC